VYRSTGWTVQSGLWRGTINTTVYRVRLLRLLPHWNCFAEFLFGSLHSGVFVGNGIGAEGANAFDDALTDNTTLTLVSLNLGGEYT
jgi:hypothetical protein